MNDKYIITAIDPVKEAEFVSVWDGGFAVTTGCRVNMVAKEVFDIEVSEESADGLDVLDEHKYYEILRENFLRAVGKHE